MAKHIPMMPETEVEKRRSWQEQVYCKKKAITEKQIVKVLNRNFLVLPGFFPPVWMDSKLLGEAVLKESKSNDLVLDMGTGTGIHGIFAASKGARVEAVDINPVALKCAKINAEKNDVAERMTVFESNLFENVDKKFDLIIFNPPFRWFKPRDMLERGSLDENYQVMKKFFKKVKNYLKENGRILMAFSDSGDIKFFEKLIEENRLKFQKIARAEQNGWKYFVYKLRP